MQLAYHNQDKSQNSIPLLEGKKDSKNYSN
jgi:hypothetical protein